MIAHSKCGIDTFKLKYHHTGHNIRTQPTAGCARREYAWRGHDHIACASACHVSACAALTGWWCLDIVRFCGWMGAPVGTRQQHKMCVSVFHRLPTKITYTNTR